MEDLAGFIQTLTQISQRYRGSVAHVGEEFSSLMDALGYLMEATREEEDQENQPGQEIGRQGLRDPAVQFDLMSSGEGGALAAT